MGTSDPRTIRGSPSIRSRSRSTTIAPGPDGPRLSRSTRPSEIVRKPRGTPTWCSWLFRSDRGCAHSRLHPHYPGAVGGAPSLGGGTGPRKANAVLTTLRGPINEACPATALRRHPGATLYLDRDAARLVL